MKITKVNSNEIIFEDNSATIKDCVINAISNGVNLGGANLGGANLGGTDLRDADLRRTYLRCTDLRDADLRRTDLRDADLGGADLRCTYLCGTDLRRAYLRCAYLSCAYLRGADLRGTDLGGVNLHGTDLRDADLRGAKNIPFIPLVCPSDGEFTGWKCVGKKLIKLLIPSDARRSSATSNKCRCDKAKVLEITDFDGSNPIQSIINHNYVETKYAVGEMVYPDSFDENRWNECSNGIHFFINKQEAINY